MSTAESILNKVKSGELSVDDAQTELQKLKVGDLKKTTYKVSPKGAISFYGIRKMPITLYSQELQIIMDLAQTSEFATFLTDNASKLATKESS